MSGRRTIRVLCVDDSALMRELLSTIVKGQPDFELVGVAADPIRAWELVQRSPPDVITLDVEMPRMDGLTFLERLMGTRPIPVLMVSSLTEKGCATTLKALELGAVDFVSKPKIDIRRGTMEIEGELVEKIRAAAAARPRSRPTELARLEVPRPATAALLKSTHKVIAIGASTGGTEALRDVLQTLPADAPGIVIVQHMPETFTRAFAERLDGLCRIRVHEAEEGDRVLPGHALIAPGGKHMSVYRSGASYQVHITEDPPVNRHRPSVDVLFNSCARDLGANAVGIILTGMGADGAKGLAAMRRAGANTIAQDEASCVVFGMPREAIATGCVDEVLPLDRIAARALALAAPNG